MAAFFIAGVLSISCRRVRPCRYLAAVLIEDAELFQTLIEDKAEVTPNPLPPANKALLLHSTKGAPLS